MKKSLLLIPVLAVIAAISACGNSGEKGRVLARIGGEAFTEGDLDLRLSTMDDLRREEVLADPELRRGEFDGILRNRLYALAAQESRFGKSASLRRREGVIDQRTMTQYYFETFLGTQGGCTRAQIEAYYQASPARFATDTGAPPALARVFGRVVDSLIVRDSKVDSFYQANMRNYLVRPSAEFSAIRTDTRKQAEAALNALRSGSSFATVAEQYSTLSSKKDGGKMGRVNMGEYSPALVNPETADSLIFTEGKRLQPGQHSGILTAVPGYLIIQVDSYTPERIPSLSEIRPQMVAEIVRGRKEKLVSSAVAELRVKHGVRLVAHDNAPSEKEIRTYYDAHRDEYESPESFELYHVEMASESKLKSAISKIHDLEQFKALASRSSENTLTKAQGGYLGVVKREFSLPYGVGTMPALFPALDEVETGLVATPVQNPGTQTWHAFWLVKKEQPSLKPVDRVRGLVLQDLKANRIATIAPQDSLAVIGKSGDVIREDDVLFLREEIPAQAQERYTRESLVDYLIIWNIFSAESNNIGLTKERKLRAQMLQGDDNFWSAIYRDSLLPQSWEQDPGVLAKVFKANRVLFTRDSSAKDWKPFARDIAAWQRLTERDFEIEYHTFPERYMRDTVPMSYAEARTSIFENLKPLAYARLDAAVYEALKKRFNVRIEDPTLNEPSLEPVAKSYKKAQDYHYDRKLDKATALYEDLRAKFPAKAGLQDSVSFGLAQIYIEQERFVQALAEYRRSNYLYPKSTNNYKAMFMIGFIQSEHLHQDSTAVRSFEAMLKKYPSSDLSDDADWMIRNIRSGGQLMPSLEDDSDDKGMSKEQKK